MNTARRPPLVRFSSSKMLFTVSLFCIAAAIASPAQGFTTVASFGGGNTGGYPVSSVTQGTDGNFYGTTTQGGTYHAYGTVYKMTPGGSITLLHSFNGTDGNSPTAGVVQGTDGNFYGTTRSGGNSNNCDGGCGMVFRISPGGSLTVLHSFNGTDGDSPSATLVQGTDGNFYGTTTGGGTNNNCVGCGTVFKMTPEGALTTLHSFGLTDGSNPNGLVQATDGSFYGTTDTGGDNCSPYGCGTVFKITPGGAFTSLYSFCPQSNCTDGEAPYAGVVQGTDGNLYGTTSEGGAYTYWGTVFKITLGGALTTLHSFDVTDGAGPLAPLVQATDGNFYGTTYGGGSGNNCGDEGCGTVFRMTPSGALTSLHSFNGADGIEPEDGLVQASDGDLYGTAEGGGAYNYGTVFELQVPPTLTVLTIGNGTVTSTDGFINCPGTCSHTYSSGAQVTLDATPGQGWVFGGWNGGCVGTGPCTVTMTQSLSVDGIFSQPLQLVTVTPCRLVDTRNPNGPFGGPPIQGGTSRTFPIPQQTPCDIPSSAAAYSLNVTVVPNGTLGYLTIWPTGENQPVVSTLNSTDGRVKANAAIVPAGTGGGVSVYVSNTTNVILDIDGYFALPGSETYQFYPLTPCRIVDTRSGNGGILHAGVERDYTIPPNCGVPSSAKAYSFNVTVLPAAGGLDYLTVWPEGEPRPTVSTLNDDTGTVVANAAIVPAGSQNATAFYAHSNSTNLLLDVDGYFAAPGTNGLSMYPAAPCRVLDTRQSGGSFSGEKTVNVEGSACAPPANAAAYVFNATVVPPGSMPFLTLWPHGEGQPTVSTLNAYDGFITSNMAIVPTTNGSINAYAQALTQLILDISGYFAP